MTAARALALALAVTSWAGRAHADVADDVGTLVRALSQSGTVTVGGPRVFMSRDSWPIVLPPRLTRGISGCTTLIVLGAVSTVFVLHAGARDGPGMDLIPSVAGVASIVRCGSSRLSLERLAVEVRSPRAILETVAVTSKTPLAGASALLPERDPGVLPPPVRPGAPPRPGPLEARAKSWSATLARDGFEDLGPKALQADAEGAGRVLLDLTPGCHRIGVFSVDSRDDTSVHDIDAELTVLSGDVVASEHTESPDATLFACAGERDVGVLSFAGAAPHGSLLLLHGVSRIPEGLPALWGRDARAAVAYNLTERHLPVPTAEPIVSAMGTAGITMVPIELVPGQCYLAAVSVIEGTAKLVSVGVTVGPSVSSSHTEEPGDAAAATFCAADRDRATISVEVHGQALAWVLGVWPGSAQRLGEEAP